MDETLNKIDEIKRRTNVSYTMAKEALEKNDGSVVDAIIYLEEKANSWGKKAQDGSKNILYGLQNVVEQNKDKKIRILKDGKPVTEIPAAVGALGIIGTLASPGFAIMGALGSMAALLNKYSLEMEKSPDDNQGENKENDIDNLS